MSRWLDKEVTCGGRSPNSGEQEGNGGGFCYPCAIRGEMEWGDKVSVQGMAQRRLKQELGEVRPCRAWRCCSRKRE